MELTSRHKAYFVVLGLAGVALGVDRLFLSGEGTGPSKASATPVAETPTQTAPPTVPAPASAPKPTLASRMEALGDPGPSDTPPSTANAFVAEWDEAPRAGAPAPAPTPARSSMAWLRLSSVVPGRAAVINGTVVFVGKEHAVPTDPDDRTPRTSGADGRRSTRAITLVRADERKVLVRIGDDEIELSLPDRSELQRLRTFDDTGVVVNPTASGGRTE